MALADDIALLSGVPLFEEMSEDKLRLIAFGAERRRLQEGQTLFREGATADCGFVVASGSFALGRRARDGSLIRFGEAGPRALLGEIAMISATERSFTAIAAEPAEVMRINRPLFRRMLEEYPEIAVAVQARISTRFRAFMRDLERVAPKLRG